MRILMVTNKVLTYAPGFQNVIEPFRQLGHAVIWAADFSKFVGSVDTIPCETRQISISSNLLRLQNLSAYRQLLHIIAEEKVDAVYCSTPIGGTLARLAAHKMHVSKVIYAAHGFLFFHGAPWPRNLLFRLHERLLAHWTDVLITITEEDWRAAQTFKLRSGAKPYLVHGAGVEIGKTVHSDRAEKRLELHIDPDAFVIVSAGFLNKNKNHRVVIDAVAKMRDQSVVYLICGEGNEKVRLQAQAEKQGVSGQVRLLGYRTDMTEIMAASDVFVMPSFREGVPRALLEAMDLGLPCVGSRTRGISDLIGDERWLFNPQKSQEFQSALELLHENKDLCYITGKKNKAKIMPYSKKSVREELYHIFAHSLHDDKN